MADKRSYSAGHFELQIDGALTTAYLKSVEGGFVRAHPLAEPIGPHNEQIKHNSVVSIEPFTVEFGISGAEKVLKWIQQSWRKDYGRRSGQITHADFDMYQTFEHEFYDALIAETKFPELDGSSKDAAYIQIKVQPERVVTNKKESQNRVAGTVGAKQKLWMCSGFRFTIDGLSDMDKTNHIDSFTIKQGMKMFYTGQDRFPTIEPTKIEFPHITGTIATAFSDSLHKWYDDTLMKGQNDIAAQKTGSLEFLSTDRTQVIFRINMYEIGIHHLEIVQSHANEQKIKRTKFELSVGRMDLDTMTGFE